MTRTVLVTGAAGFIGAALSQRLLLRGDRVVGLDNLNDYYDPALKQARLREIEAVAPSNAWRFERMSLEDGDALMDLFAAETPSVVVNLAAQAGVRYSLEKPAAYIQSNLVGFGHILESCRHHGVGHLVYASSSSVYGGNRNLPFHERQAVNHPVSLYAASKKANELMAHTYSHLYGLPATGLRFFTVYGPWGRPDMSPYIFTKSIIEEKPIKVFNKGKMMRDFTFVDDIVSGILSALDTPPIGLNEIPPYKIYNLGNNKPVSLMNYINVIERACNKDAIIDLRPMQAGDVVQTYADIEESEKDLGYAPTTSIDIGIPQFVDWFISYHS